MSIAFELREEPARILPQYRQSWELVMPSIPELDPDKIPYEILRWNDIAGMNFELARSIQASGQQFDTVVYALRGGKFPGVAVAQALGLDAVPIGARLYKGIQAGTQAREGSLDVYLPLEHPEALRGRHVLFIDEVNHTSTTMMGIRRILEKDIQASSVRVGVLHEKDRFKQVSADFVVRTTDSWIVYPWEHEGSELHNRWEFFEEKFPVWMLRDEGLVSWSECMQRAIEIGFYEDELPSLADGDFAARLIIELARVFREKHGQDIQESVLSYLFQ